MKTIGISATGKSPGVQRTLDALSEILDVRFEERIWGDGAGLDAWILPEADPKIQTSLVHNHCSSYTVIRSDQLVSCGSSSDIKFSQHRTLPPVLVGRRIKAAEAAELKSLPLCLNGLSVIASKGGAPIWGMREVERLQHHFVGLPIPELNEDEPLFHYFHRGQFLQLLPLILFLRSVTDVQGWEQPPLQACFMFDDPNLHWRTYGYFDFTRVAAHAQRHNYHVSLATIPLDMWLVHKPTALLFHQYRDQLSLLIHGNDHIAKEFAKSYLDKELDRRLRQTLKRVEDFELRSGVRVSRVMAPPHGACSERALGKMANLGFEAASISRGSLHRHNGNAKWLRTLGMRATDIIGGLPVFPRFPLSGSCHNSILIAALLHQPIIPMGHHEDVAEGLKLLADLAEYVNSLGTVHWAGMERIACVHYARRFDGGTFQIRMYTRRVEIPVPEGISHILPYGPRMHEAESESLAWRHLNGPSKWTVHHTDEPIPVSPSQVIEIVTALPALSSIDVTSSRDFHLWPVMRRLLTETRDRLVPVLRRSSLSR